MSYQAARAVKEKYAALKARADYEQQIGDLIAREDVDASMKFIGASIRSQMEVFPDQIAPIVAPLSNLDEVHTALSNACRNVLEQLGISIERRLAMLEKDAS